MSHFAEIENNIVKRVILIEQEELNTGNWGDPSNWIQTCPYTRGNKCYDPITNQLIDRTPFRKNFACIGMIYDSQADAFYWPEPPLNGFILSTETYEWVVPFPPPDDGNDYIWDQESCNWVINTITN
jgi:hypothetical protein